MIAIIQYNAGNTKSVFNAMQKLSANCIITEDLEVIQKADKVIFPGVGEASTAIQYIKNNGLYPVLPQLKQPFLGICLGQQLMCKHNEEGDVHGLGIFDVSVKKFPPQDLVPHTGWNNLMNLNGQLFKGLSEFDDFYFVHSFYCETNTNSAADCNYILPFSAALEKDNFFSAQFHPEKSGKSGLKFLENFIKL